MANPFVHVELHTNDLARAREFYSKLFDWKLQDVPMPGSGGTYTMIDVGGGTGGGIDGQPGARHAIALVGLRRGRRHRRGDEEGQGAGSHSAHARWTVKYDKVRVALGLAHMADDLRKYAAKTTCPVAILRGSRGSELTLEDAKSVVGCWKNATVIDVEGDYALQMENPAGLAEALIKWSA